MNVASAASKLRDFRDSCHQTLDHNVPRTQSGQSLTNLLMFNTSFGSLVQLCPPAFCIFVWHEQKCFGPTCERILPPEVQSCLRSPVINNGVGKCLHQFPCPREESHCNLDATLFLAWCLHEARHRRRRFITAAYRVASFFSTVRLITCRKEHDHVVKVAFKTILRKR